MALDIRPQPKPNKGVSIFYEGSDAIIDEYTKLLEFSDNLECLANWFLRYSVRPQPGIILAAIISTCSILMGRGICLFGKKANVYTLVISGTSTGKNAVFTLSKNIIRACGCDHVIGADSIASGEGLIKELSIKPEIIWPLDEIQDMIKNVGGAKASSYAVNISKYLKTMYSGNADFKERVLGSDKEPDKAPLGELYPVILSAAQPLSFWANANRTMVADGFIPRFLAFTGDEEVLIDSNQLMAMHLAPHSFTEMPKKIIDQMKLWTHRKVDQSLMELANVPGQVPSIRCAGSHEAFVLLQQTLTDFDFAIRTLYKEDQTMAELVGKNTEYLVKCALISAWIRSPASAYLIEDDVRWAARVVKVSNTLMRDGFLRYNVVNDFERNVAAVLSALADAPNGLTKDKLSKRLRGVSSYNIDQLLVKATEMGDVTVSAGMPDENGRRIRVYHHNQHVEESIDQELLA